MKNDKINDALSMIDGEFIEEARPDAALVRKRKIRNITSLAACFGALIVALGFWLFVPFNTEMPDVTEYEESRYYPIIQKLNVATFRKPYYKNNFDKILNNLSFDLLTEDDDADGEAEAHENGYIETTDNQVQGVIEADIVKASSKHLFYLWNGKVNVYGINGEQSGDVGEYEIDLASHVKKRYVNYSSWEMYLSADGNTLTVIAPYSDQDENVGYTALITLDVSDPTQIKQKNQTHLRSAYISSRLTESEMLLFTGFDVGLNPDFSDESAFVPQYNCGNGFVSLSPDKIFTPETLSSAIYTVIWRFDPRNGELKEYTAYLSYSDVIYVSADNAFVTRSYTDEYIENGYTLCEELTEIAGIRYSGHSFEHIGKITVSGYLKDQYSMDEYNGILRIAATTRKGKYHKYEYKGEEYVNDIQVATSASLYCIDLESWQITASVGNFAPNGETVQSARFDGDMAYVCTAVKNTDPVFFFDLSDLGNIVYTDTGTIPGFSTSLIQFGNGYLLGIGQGIFSNTLKIEVYEEREGSVVSVCVKEYTGAHWSQDYKADLVNRENSLIGLGVQITGKESTYNYILLHFDGEELEELCKTQIFGRVDAQRGVYIDGYLYMFGEDDFKVVKIS